MYRPARRRKEPKQEKEGKKGLTREERLSLYDSMLYGIGAREGEGGERVIEKAREIACPEDLQLLFIDYADHLRSQAEKGINIVPDLEGFCSFAGISRRKWKEMQRKTDFSNLTSRISTIIAAQEKQLAYRGMIPPIVLAMDFNNNHDYLSSVNTLEIRQNVQENGLPSRDDIIASLPTDQGKEKTPEE